MFFLDTNICIFILKNKYPTLIEHLKLLSPQQVKIASIVKAELLLGAEKSQNPQKTKLLIQQFLSPFEVVGFNDSACEHYSKIRASLEKKGTPIGPNDLILAATVLAHKATLVTRNTKEFSRIKTLACNDWG